jgi:hypothetical protein
MTTMMMAAAMMMTPRHQRKRSLPRRNLPSEPALTTVTPPTWRVTPSETSMGATTATTTTTMGATTTTSISSPTTPSTSCSINYIVVLIVLCNIE